MRALVMTLSCYGAVEIVDVLLLLKLGVTWPWSRPFLEKIWGSCSYCP